MILSDEDIETILKSVKRLLEEHREGPFDLAAVYYPAEEEEFIAILQYDKRITLH
jgi:hypothetical protein